MVNNISIPKKMKLDLIYEDKDNFYFSIPDNLLKVIEQNKYSFCYIALDEGEENG